MISLRSSPRSPATTVAAAVGAGMLLAVAGCSDPQPAGPSAGTAGPTNAAAAPQNAVEDFDSVPVDPAAADKLPESVKASKQISVVMNVSSAPTKFRADDNSSIVGLNPDIARALGRTLGVEVKIEDVQFDGIIPGLQSKRYQLAVSSMAPSAERVKVLDMVRYSEWGTSLAVKTGNPLQLSAEAMCGRSIGVQQGSIQNTQRVPELSDKCTASGKDAIKQVVLPDQTSALLQLSTGRVDGVLADTPVLAWALKQRPGTIELAGEINRAPVAVALAEDSELTPAVQAGLQTLMESPAYQQILDKWGMSDSGVKEAVLEDGTSS